MAEGYLTDTPYTWGFYAELNPSFLNYICILNGHAPRPLDRPFTYCDLGCGHGLSIIAFAELYPQARFIGVDFNEQHVANGRAMAADAGLTNVEFHSFDFNDLAVQDLPDFDFVVAHGVYSWVDPGRRNSVRQFLNKKVKPAGIVYVSYDTMPGWAAIAPLRELMLQHTRGLTTDSFTKAQAGLDFIAYLRERKAGFFEDNPPLAAFVDEISRQNVSYVAHEFFGGAIKPYYFREVATEMRSAGLSYSGSALVHLNFVDLAVPSDFRQLLVKSTSRHEFESNGDFIRNQRFRKDVFVMSRRPDGHGGEPTLKLEEQAAALAAIPFGTTCSAEAFKRTHRFGEVELKFVAEVFERVIEACAAGAKSVNQLVQIDGLSSYGPQLLTDAIRFLSAGGQLVPFQRTTKTPSSSALTADRYTFPAKTNIAFLKARLLHQPMLGLVAPAAGIGIEVSMADALFALCSVESKSDGVGGWAFRRLLESGKQMVFEGGGSELTAVENALETFRKQRLAKFIELGILAPAS
jgi:SAM-dependent methyltransferase